MADRPKLAAIDLLRFVAAAGVMAYHFGSVAPLLAEAPVRLFDPAIALPSAGARWTWCGWVGVQVFFVISGYVIALSAEGASAGAFLRRRALRLVPAAWICATLTAAVLLAASTVASPTVLERWGSAMLFVPRTYPIDGSYWTLGLETGFYLLCALALRSRTFTVERLGIAIGAASVLFWAVQNAAPMTQQILGSMPVRLTLLPHGCFFALGVILYALRSRPRDPALRGLALAFFATGTCQILDQANAQSWTAFGLLYPWLPVTLFAAGVAVVAKADALQPLAARLLPARAIALLGLATYPLYLLHQVVGSALIAALAARRVPAAAVLFGTAAAMIALALLVTATLEPALRRWLAERLLPRRGPRPDILPSASLPAG
jgi:exopolysaccharide production protein ExoZ